MRKSTLFLGALMAVGLTACTQSDDLASLESSLASSSSLLQITTSGTNVTTRFDASTGCWESEDAIGVYMTSSDGTLQGEGYDNVKYTLASGEGSSTGTFTSETGILKPDDGTSVNFHAYYPYSDEISDGVYSLDISDQSNGFKDYDLMYASEGSKTSDDLDSGLSLTFEHQVAKATIKVYTSLTLTEASISGVPTAIDFTINGGTSSTATESGSIAPYGGEVSSEADEDDDDDSTDDTDTESSSDDDSSSDETVDYNYLYEAILLPMTEISNLTLKFTTSDGLVYSWKPATLTSISAISAGYEYVFGIYIEYSSSTGSGSSDDYIYEVTATGSPFTSYTTEDLTGDATQASYVDDLGIECIIDVDASSTGLSSLLSDAVASDASITAVALRFSSSETYSNELGTIEIPDGITTLALICDNSDAASISLTGLENGSSLENLYLYNLDITGTSGTSFVYNCDITGTISVEDCSITSVDELFNLNYPSAYTNDTDDGLTLIVKNSVINASTLIKGGVVSCTLENSTFTTTSYLFQAEDGVQACSITVNACTFDVNDFMFSAPSSYESTADNDGNTNELTFNNSVVAYLASNYFYNKIATSSASGSNNYYVSSDDTTNIYATAQGGTAQVPATLTYIATKVDTYSTLFSESYNSAHSLTSPTYWLTSDYSDKGTGDPRWYYSNYSASSEE